MLYAAYGSNMSSYEMKIRCPNAKYIGRGVIPSYKLVMSGLGHLNIVKQEFDENNVACQVPVAIFEIEKDEGWEQLDYYEGYPDYYIKKKIEITPVDISAKEYPRPIEAIVYIMTDKYANKGFVKCEDDYYRRVKYAYEERNFAPIYLDDAYNNYEN